MQRTSGAKTAWEDILVEVFGPCWRAVRDAQDIRSRADIMDEFIEKVCAGAGLSTCRSTRPEHPPHEQPYDVERSSKKQRLTFQAEGPRADELQDTPAALWSWTRWEMSFLFVCDNKLLVDACCGRARLADGRDAPMLHRISNGIFAMMASGWQPPSIATHPIAWLPRSHNEMADGLADFTMDERLSWTWTFPTTLEPGTANIVVQTDGGRRSSTCASASMVVGLFTKTPRHPVFEPWYAEGLFLSTGVTVFQAEAIALDRAVGWVRPQVSSKAFPASTPS